MKYQHINDPYIGQVVRYSDGCSALCRLHSEYAGHFHGEHVLGGYLFVLRQNLFLLGDEGTVWKNLRREWKMETV